MADLKRFSRRMQFRAGELGTNINKAVKLVALAADQTVVLATPVDTGRARSNWIVTLGTPNTTSIPPHSPGSLLGLGERANATASIDAAKQVIATRKEDQTIFIANNLTYIEPLNKGHSAQAGPRFVEKAVRAAAAAVRRVKIFK